MVLIGSLSTPGNFEAGLMKERIVNLKIILSAQFPPTEATLKAYTFSINIYGQKTSDRAKATLKPKRGTKQSFPWAD